jgi:hypothetical protein
VHARKRHRAIAWSLIALASALLVFSIMANWVQTKLLDTDKVTDTTQKIVTDPAVEEQLSLYLVDQLYTTVDVQAQIEARLPDQAKPLAGPISAAARGLANDAAQRALADPRVQNLVTDSVSRAHEQFVKLIEDEGEYVATTGGEVTMDYGSLVADLAVRLGLDPATVTEIRSVVQSFSQDLKTRLTEAQTQLAAARAGLAEAQDGALTPELRQTLVEFAIKATALQDAIGGIEKKIGGIEDKVPSQLQDRLSEIQGLLAGVDQRVTKAGGLASAVLKNPSQENLHALDARLAAVEAPVSTLLERQALQTPGQLTIMDSDQLDGVQTLVSALRNLGIVLPLLVLLLYMAAIFLAKGWRSQAMVGVGAGILMATLLILAAMRLLDAQVVSGLASSDTVEPAVQAVWDALSDGLRDRVRFVLVIGLAFIVAGLLASPGQRATAVRRWLAPYLRSHPVAVYTVVAALILLWLTFIPAIDNLGQVVALILLAILAVFGVEALRRQTAREFPQAHSDG